MSRLDGDDTFDLAEGLHPEGPSGEDLDRFGGEFVRCPSCSREIYDQSEVCPHCGEAVEESRLEKGMPRWAVVTAVVAIVGVVALILLT